MQDQAGEGPAAHVLRHGRPVRIQDTATLDRWPRFCRQAARSASAPATPCRSSPTARSAGALLLYARQPGAFGPEEARRAEKFAGHASGALALSLRMASCLDQNEQLRSSIVSRAVIDQALGVIMATEHCPQDKAFALLRSVSQNTNVKLRDLAATIVTRVSGEPPGSRHRSRTGDARSGAVRAVRRAGRDWSGRGSEATASARSGIPRSAGRGRRG